MRQLNFAPQGHGDGESFYAGIRQSQKALAPDGSGRDFEVALFLQKPKAAGEGSLVQHQDFADTRDGDRLKLRDGGQDSELGGAEAGRFETVVVKAANSASGAAKVESGTRAGSGEVERIGGSSLDLHIHLKYK